MMRYDLHIHTNFSCDATTTMEEYCQEALKKGIGCLCFTDHEDPSPFDPGYGYYDAEGFLEAFYRVRDRYAGRLILLSGVEFSEPQRFPREFEACTKREYDLVIGSVHFYSQQMLLSQAYRQGVSIDRCFDAYFSEQEKAVKMGGMDVLGHMDYPKKYYGEERLDPSRLRALFSQMQSQGILPEINTASLRKGLPFLLPDETLLSLYAASGGKRVVMGSDAHCRAELGSGIDQAETLAARLGLTNGYIQRRRWIGAEDCI